MKKLAKLKLGRGIGAILEEVEEAYANDIKSGAETITEIDINNIKPNPYQPRKKFDEEKLRELSESIKEHGLLQPIVVIKKKGVFILIAGERRLRASKLAEKEKIRAIIADISLEKLRELALMENIQRENLNPIELALSLNELIEKYNVTHDKLAEIVHKSRTYVTNVLRLLNLSEYTQDKISEGLITSGHAKVLVGLEPTEEKKIVNSIINQKLSVREAENMMRDLKNKGSDKKPVSTGSNNTFDFSELENELGRIVKKLKTKNNTMTLEFDSQEAINVLLRRISR